MYTITGLARKAVHLVRAGVSVACLFNATIVSIAVAAPEPAPPLSARPVTILQNLETAYRYVPSLMAKYGSAQAEAGRKIVAVANEDTPVYDRGADIAEVMENIVHDFEVIVGDFLDCLDFKIIGLCYKITWTGIHFDIYREYRLPVQDVEVVDTPFKSGFIPKIVNDVVLPVVEDTYYPLAKDVATAAMQWSGSSVEMQGSIIGANYNVPSDGVEGTDRAADEAKSKIEELKRFRNADPITGGGRYAEYTVLPQLFNQIMGRLWFFCHDVLPVGIWSSYYPLQIMPARMSAISFLFFPFEMINKFMIPNSCAGVNNMLRGGKTPVDMTLSGIAAYDALNLMSPGSGCLKQNDGGFVPVTNFTNNTSFPVASVNASVKGIKIANRMMPMNFYDINLERDRWQWSHSERMPDNCSKLERFVRNFNSANMKKDKDNWNVGIHWRYLRCCRRGFHILIGPRPFIYR